MYVCMFVWLANATSLQLAIRIRIQIRAGKKLVETTIAFVIVLATISSKQPHKVSLLHANSSEHALKDHVNLNAGLSGIQTWNGIGSGES